MSENRTVAYKTKEKEKKKIDWERGESFSCIKVQINGSVVYKFIKSVKD